MYLFVKDTIGYCSQLTSSSSKSAVKQQTL